MRTDTVAGLSQELADKIRARQPRGATAAYQPPAVEYITPVYPPLAISVARAHERDNKKPAIACVVAQNTNAKCKNCNDLGEVYLRLCSAGPFQGPPGLGSVGTYFQGDERFGRGWYVYDKTRGYPCPKCGGGER